MVNRRTQSRRAALSYDQLRRLTKESGNMWPDLLIKDYQGILQDFIVLANDADEFDGGIGELQYRVFQLVNIEEDYTTGPFETIICKNAAPIEITLDAEPKEEDEVRIKRTDAEVVVIGEIDGYTNRTINLKNYSMLLVFDGEQWREI